MTIKNADDVLDVLRRIKFAPSCVDMGWEWEVETVTGLVIATEHAGYMIRTTFQRPDRDTGKVQRGFGRWWHVPYTVTETGLAKTAFAAAKLILEHELMESFRFDGVRIFDPHHDIEDLRAAAQHRAAMSGGGA